VLRVPPDRQGCDTWRGALPVADLKEAPSPADARGCGFPPVPSGVRKDDERC